ncbi:MAG: FAD-dependent oxidoreductase, partial [Clostridia bacterium]|nr:FAD-dependent oxidoreductase [Clostridia bacterium]
MIYDVAVVGAGVCGALIASALSHCDIKVALVEKCNDVAMGTSKANSAIVHAGFDALPGTLKAKFNVEGTAMMPALCETLHVPFKPIGSLVVAFSEEEKAMLDTLLERGHKNGVPGLEIYDQAKLREVEPYISEQALAALYAPTAGL